VTPSRCSIIMWLEGEEMGLTKRMHIHGFLVETLIACVLRWLVDYTTVVMRGG
jgi:hypothetical protein